MTEREAGESELAQAVTDAQVEAAAMALSEYGIPDVPVNLWRVMALDALEAARDAEEA